MNKEQRQLLQPYRIYTFKYVGKRYNEQGALIACSCCFDKSSSAGTWDFSRYAMREHIGLCVDLVAHWCSACVEMTIGAQWLNEDEPTLQHMLLGRLRGETLIRAEKGSELVTCTIKPGKVNGNKIGLLLIGEIEKEKTTP